MAKIFERIDEHMGEWIAAQHLYFVGTAPLGLPAFEAEASRPAETRGSFDAYEVSKEPRNFGAERGSGAAARVARK